MTQGEMLLGFGLLVVALLLWRFFTPRPAPRDRGLPAELVDASIVLQEQEVRAPAIGLIAKPDRVYRVAGELVLVELKTRLIPRVFDNDRIELSVQRVVLEDAGAGSVSRHAWVLCEDTRTGERKALPVKLMERDEVLALRERYEALVAGTARPRSARSIRQCRECAYLARCQRTYQDRGAAGAKSSPPS